MTSDRLCILPLASLEDNKKTFKDFELKQLQRKYLTMQTI